MASCQRGRVAKLAQWTEERQREAEGERDAFLANCFQREVGQTLNVIPLVSSSETLWDFPAGWET